MQRRSPSEINAQVNLPPTVTDRVTIGRAWLSSRGLYQLDNFSSGRLATFPEPTRGFPEAYR